MVLSLLLTLKIAAQNCSLHTQRFHEFFVRVGVALAASPDLSGIKLLPFSCSLHTQGFHEFFLGVLTSFSNVVLQDLYYLEFTHSVFTNFSSAF